MPPEVADELIESGHVFADFVRFAWNPTLVEPGDELDGWRILGTPGHADGHLVLHRGDVLIAGDTLLTPITPAIGLYPESRPDPLGDYLESLELVAGLAPRICVRRPRRRRSTIRPARCAAIADHHADRLDRTEAALGREPRTRLRRLARPLRRRRSPPIQRRFAVAEALSHLERLVVRGPGRGETSDDRMRHLYSLTRWWTTSLLVPTPSGVRA